MSLFFCPACARHATLPGAGRIFEIHSTSPLHFDGPDIPASASSFASTFGRGEFALDTVSFY